MGESIPCYCNAEPVKRKWRGNLMKIDSVESSVSGYSYEIQQYFMSLTYTVGSFI